MLIDRIRTIVAGWELTEPELGAHLERRDYAQPEIAGRPERMTVLILTHVSRPGLVILAALPSASLVSNLTGTKPDCGSLA